jgi:hypothetical protein
VHIFNEHVFGVRVQALRTIGARHYRGGARELAGGSFKEKKKKVGFRCRRDAEELS